MLLPLIMAGGLGSRLWPLSRQQYPKQFLPLVGENTMLQETILRLKGLDISDPVVICNEEQRFLAAEQMRTLGFDHATMILEPFPRNTAPAIALAALHACQGGHDPVLLVLAADHHIKNVPAFHEAVRQAAPLAEEGKLVTFGIVPSGPETGYGYIKRGDEAGGGFAVTKFEEKPDLATAEAYLQSGDYYWNSGMFLFHGRKYLAELKQHSPKILEACENAMAGAKPDLQFVRVDPEAFRLCPDDSIDYAVMERTEDAVVVPLDALWNDIGSWSALRSTYKPDEAGNVFQGDVLSVSTKRTFVRAESRLVALVGVENLVIVETKDAVLVAREDRVQEVKGIVDQLKEAGRGEHVNHRQVYRPWGHYDSIDLGDRYQVKRITVKPGARLSVQMHHHRAEHWIVVRGTAKVYKGKETLLLGENQSIYIPLGETHALENPGKIPLELIEVQSGSYLGEDDIVRFEDLYGRQ